MKILDCERKKVTTAPPGCRYVALSYVWGPQPTNNNISDLSTKIALPKTISDSCTINQSLGYMYLWVDRYVSKLYDTLIQFANTYSV